MGGTPGSPKWFNRAKGCGFIQCPDGEDADC